jgi:hypothetical protein
VPVGAISTVAETEGVGVGVGFGGLGGLAASTAAVLAMMSPMARITPTPALAVLELIGLRIGRLPGLERALVSTGTSDGAERFQAFAR